MQGLKELTDWLDSPSPAVFPVDQVVERFHQVGKHFVPDDLLKSLALARERLSTRDVLLAESAPEQLLLNRFLDTALDKFDDRYNYPSYTALNVLALSTPDDGPELAPAVWRRRDAMAVQLLADAVRFELDAAEGRTELMPEMRPCPALVGKRYRLALRVAGPALARLGLEAVDGPDDPAGAARALVATAEAQLSDHERRMLQVSMLPVYVSHDEYLFIRVLQTFEITFAMLALQLKAAIQAVGDHQVDLAADRLDGAAAVLTESAPLFSLLATMQIESFRTFREFTEGASAIQSSNYKLLESLCRTPDPERRDSPAYLSTPQIRDRVLDGQQTLDDACAAALADPRYGEPELRQLSTAMRGFASALRRWRQTHYRLAVRMLGDRSGTGYTEGTPYLSSVRSIPVFRSIDDTAEGDSE